jgi:hypothetical protein
MAVEFGVFLLVLVYGAELFVFVIVQALGLAWLCRLGVVGFLLSSRVVEVNRFFIL